MHILFVVPYAPTRIRVRPYNLLGSLLQRGHSVTLATLWQDQEECALLDEWRQAGAHVVAMRHTRQRSLWNSVAALPTRVPLQAVFSWQPALIETIIVEAGRSPAQPYDVVHVEHLRGAQYALRLKEVYRVPVVWDSVDCISYLFEQAATKSLSAFGRWVTRLDLARTRAYEAWLSRQFDRVLMTSPADMAALQALAVRYGGSKDAGSPITVLPNGVDLSYFQAGAGQRDPLGIVFTGKMSYHANVTAALFFARQALPLIWAQKPAATLTIAGHHPTAEVSALATDPRIIVTGSVPDLRPYLQRAAVAVAPMPYGAGLQNKVLEAMACETPVVATPQAVAALHVRSGEHLLVADGAPAMADAVLNLLDNEDLQKRLGQAGRQYVEAEHSWANIAERLEAVYDELVKM